MKSVGKQTFLTTLVAILVVMNIGLVAFMWFTQQPDRAQGPPAAARFLLKELGFNKNQEQKYIELQQHFEDSLEPVRHHERDVHDRFFEMMHASAPDSAQLAATIDTMAHIRSQIEYLTFSHFRQIRALCNNEQQQKFDKIILETMRKMGPPSGGRRPGPEGRRP